MKGIKLMTQGIARNVVKAGALASTLLVTAVSYADTGSSTLTMDILRDNVATTSNNVLKIILTLITIAGIILVVKGIVHLKQNYTGSGQEKHLSKGLASLGFGAALFIAVPITHILVQSLSGSGAGTQYDSWQSELNAQSIS